MCVKHGLVYTRFVDDITISGQFDIRSGSFAKVVAEILGCYGFTLKQSKQQSGRLSEGLSVTKLRIKRGCPDVRKMYIEEVKQQLDNAVRLARGESPLGCYFTAQQILGRIDFITWINPGQRAQLFRKFRSIEWSVVEAEAARRGLVATVKKIVPISDWGGKRVQNR
jgi:hypothetical protein